MTSLILYDEFGKNMGLPSIKDFFEKEPYKNKQKILEYLKSKKDKAVRMGTVIDIITGEKIAHETLMYNDGIYSWNSTLIYYVEKYNLRLPKEFEEYVTDSN